ncbi:hypothetical protein HZA99_03820 [Candidatus Woesearchaeota archaeon]|nr:hypothetical protein [Candidatus Woesearchaeota archaeon]
MKEFVLRARKAKTDAGINLDQLPKEGKMDSVCASISNALWISGDVRKDTIIHVVLEGPTSGPKTISFFGNEIKGLRHDERSIATYIVDALKRSACLQLNEENHVRAGIKISKKSFERLLWELSQKHTQAGKKRQVLVLDKDGKDIRGVALDKDVVVVFGSPEGLPPKTENFFKEIKAEKVSIGPNMLFAAHCPIIIHNELDRRGL